jgi:hypothetical protein
MANLRSTEQSPSAGPSAGLSGRRRVQAFAFGGLLLVLMNFSGPDAGMIDLPVSFFLKNLSEPQSQPLAGNKHFGAIRRNTPTFPVTKLPDWKPPWPKPLR